MRDKKTKKNRASTDVLLFLKSREVLFVLVTSAIVAVGAPVNILTRSPSLSRFVSLISHRFPCVSGYIEVSEFPQISGIYFSISALITPILLVHFWRVRLFYIERMNEKFQQSPLRFRLGVCVIAFIAFAALYISYFVTHKFEYSSIPISSSRMALALFGWIFGGGAAWISVAASLLAVRVAIRK
jgi:hypothetical protein